MKPDRIRKKYSCLVAYNSTTKKYFGLEESFAATSPLYLESPWKAKKIMPHELAPKLFTDIKEAPYYFENSDRMRDWLKGFEMIKITITETFAWSQ